MSATDVLKDEHRGVERMLAIVEAAGKRLEAGGDVPADLYLNAVDFFRGFTDGCHHAKEEEKLFPALEQRGVPREGGPIGVMLAEHEQGRAYVRAMAEAAGRYSKGDKSAVPVAHPKRARLCGVAATAHCQRGSHSVPDGRQSAFRRGTGSTLGRV